MAQQIPDDILSKILDAYGSLEKPHYWFVEREFSKRPYAALIDELRTQYEVLDTTDLNDDVCISLSLTGDPRPVACFLSFVGPYACVAEITGEGKHRIITAAVDDDRRPIFSALNRHVVQVLPQNVINLRVQFGNFSCELEEVSLYEILFSKINLVT